jgi:calcineurin-like phosphoesterase
VDFHAEATAEKIALGYYADKLGVSAFAENNPCAEF